MMFVEFPLSPCFPKLPSKKVGETPAPVGETPEEKTKRLAENAKLPDAVGETPAEKTEREARNKKKLADFKHHEEEQAALLMRENGELFKWPRMIEDILDRPTTIERSVAPDKLGKIEIVDPSLANPNAIKDSWGRQACRYEPPAPLDLEPYNGLREDDPAYLLLGKYKKLPGKHVSRKANTLQELTLRSLTEAEMELQVRIGGVSFRCAGVSPEYCVGVSQFRFSIPVLQILKPQSSIPGAEGMRVEHRAHRETVWVFFHRKERHLHHRRSALGGQVALELARGVGLGL